MTWWLPDRLERYLAAADAGSALMPCRPPDPWPGTVPDGVVRALREYDQAVIDLELAYRSALLRQEELYHRGRHYPVPIVELRGVAERAADDLGILVQEHARAIKQLQVRYAARWTATAILAVRALAEGRRPDAFAVLYEHGVQSLADVLPLLATPVPTHRAGAFLSDEDLWPRIERLKRTAQHATAGNKDGVSENGETRDRAGTGDDDPALVLSAYAEHCQIQLGLFAVDPPQQTRRASRRRRPKLDQDTAQAD